MNIEILKTINNSWTLFIDRDGVINHEKKDDYIHTWEEFEFYDGAKEAMKIFNETFGRIILVTNQRGIAKGITKLEALEVIHKNMLEGIEKSGGRIDRIYFCPDMDGPNRKPNHGMGLQAAKDFPEIDLTKSVMIGNTLSDMAFGRNLGVAINIFLPTTRKEVDVKDKQIDLVFPDLISAATALIA